MTLYEKLQSMGLVFRRRDTEPPESKIVRLESQQLSVSNAFVAAGLAYDAWLACEIEIDDELTLQELERMRKARMDVRAESWPECPIPLTAPRRRTRTPTLTRTS